MNRKIARTVVIAVALVLMAGAPLAFAQAKGAFSIVCDLTGARVYLNGELAGYTKPTFSTLLSPGQYSVRVSASGYTDYLTTIQMTSNPLTLNVRFKAQAGQAETMSRRYRVTITSNIKAAQVYIDNRPAGTAPVTLPLERGSHSLRVTAPGYEDLNEVIAVRGDMTFSAVLQGRAYRLSVTANVVGAQVYVNNAPVGSTPFEGRFAAGTYSVRVTAQGYQEAGTTISLSRDESLAFALQSAEALVSIRISPAFLDPQDRNALAQIKVYIDGDYVHGFTFQLPAGTHNIRISSGGLSVSGDFDLVPGRSYTIEPTFGLIIR
jgi:hypothetical protein